MRKAITPAPPPSAEVSKETESINSGSASIGSTAELMLPVALLTYAEDDPASATFFRISEQGDRKHHFRIRQHRQQGGCVGRSLDQHRRRTERVEGLDQPPGRA